MARLLALVDGEHYPPVVRAAIDHAGGPAVVAAALLVGGTEKLRGEDDGYGVPVERIRQGEPVGAAMLAAARRHAADGVLDLSDEPVIGQDERVALACEALAAGLPYQGPDFHFRPPPRAPLGVPAVAVIGTGKRVGKTSVSAHLARLAAAAGREVVVVAMGRGGPAEPEPVDVRTRPLGVPELLARARAGQHAASDFLEDAVLAGVPTVGARRCGGGLFGEPFLSNVPAAAALAAAGRPDVVVLEGSGAAIPPVAADRTLLVHPAPEGRVGRGFDRFRLLLADLVVLTMCEPGLDVPPALSEDVPMIRTVLRPHPAQPLAGRRVAYFTTAPEPAVPAHHLMGAHGIELVAVSGNLADRARLREDLARAEAARADAYLVEVKAAAIDAVAEAADARGVEVVLCDNRPVAIAGEPDLDDALRRIVGEAVDARG